MAGNKIGGQRAAATNRAKHGESFYSKIGRMGNTAWNANGRKPRGFSLDPERASIAGRTGGMISKRTKRSTA